MTRKRDNEKKERDFSRVFFKSASTVVGRSGFSKRRKKIVQRHLTTTLKKGEVGVYLSEYVLARTQKKCFTMGLLPASFVVRIKRGEEKEEISIGGFCSNGCGRGKKGFGLRGDPADGSPLNFGICRRSS